MGGGLCAVHPTYHGGDLRSHGRGTEDREKMGSAGRAHRRGGRRAPETLQRGDGYAPGVERKKVQMMFKKLARIQAREAFRKKRLFHKFFTN